MGGKTLHTLADMVLTGDLVHPTTVELTGRYWLFQRELNPLSPYYQENILALHQPLNEQVDFTQGNNRAKVRVVANYPP